MKLIIDIDKELKSAVYNCGLFLNPSEKVSLINAINNGTPLPKGHGTLKDVDNIKTAFPCGEYIRTESVRATIDHEETIIEADKAESEVEE